MQLRERDYLRVMAHADLLPNGCRVSRYSVGSHGYAQAWDGKTVVLAHRLVWAWEKGPIPDGMTVDHEECRNRKCINTDHMRLLDNFENARRTSGRNWPLGECAQGHPNSELRQWGKRKRCRVCHNEKQRRSRARRRVGGS